MTPGAGILLTAVSLTAGWIGLWPVRGRLGAAGYHLAAYPVGLLLWPLAVAVRSALRIGFAPVPFYVVAVAALFAASRLAASSVDGETAGEDPGGAAGARVPAASYALWGAAVVGVAAIVDVTGYTSALYDSVFHFERWGAWLTVTGIVHREIMESYGAFIPSVHAVNRYFGGDWASTPYPVLSLHVASIFAAGVRRWTRDRVSVAASWSITAGFTLLLVTTPRYLHHSLYVHGHMFTAAYLVLAMYATQRAYLDGSSTAEEDRTAWLIVAGLASAGVALTRADGIAYVLVPALTATLVWWEGGHRLRDQAVYVVATAAAVAVVFCSAFARLRFWRGGKLSGKRAASVLTVVAAVAVSTLGLDRLGPLGGWLRRGRNLLLTLVALEAAALLALAARRPEDFAQASLNMITNMLRSGGNGHLWYFGLGVLAVSLLYGGQWRSGRWPGYLLFAIGQFFFVAVVVHAMSHVGRLSPNDSFNRVSFHVVPLVFWYAATVTTAVVAEYAKPRALAVVEEEAEAAARLPEGREPPAAVG
ncbi:MAG: hypothetical protein IBX62_10030 [Coriobacteriia bacterium]|nr:hypothetical protein [Coriobacteriia bacterium]